MRWYVTDIYLFTPMLISICFCVLMQVDDKFVSMLHSKPVVYEDLTDENAKVIYLVFIRLSIALSVVFVTDYILLFYYKQPIYQTLGIIGGLYNIYNKVESRLAKLSLFLAFYVVNRKNPYQNQTDENTNNRVGIIPIH